MLLTELSMLSQPFLLGNSIDGLIIGNYHWLILLAISYIASNIFEYKRMVYDTKVYTQIYNNIVFDYIKDTKDNNSKKITRTELVYQVVNVLEGYVHYYISTIVTIIGSLWFIFSKNIYIGFILLFGFVFITSAALFYYKKIRQSINVKHNQHERKLKSFEQGQFQITSFFNRSRRLHIYESTLQGKNWFLINFIKNVFKIICIVVLIKTTTILSAGFIIMIYSYANNFMNSLSSIPIAVEMYSRISDILKRLD